MKLRRWKIKMLQKPMDNIYKKKNDLIKFK